ncbi:hypothetical protein HDU93_001447 [Gonapodya sp. JEL0774]|nr:hypothetical protein HDU93_001447 [Gonapodya sp. JEL0774]
MAGSPINFAVIGYGLSAKVFHIPHIGCIKSFRLYGIVQRSPTPQNDAKKDHPDAIVWKDYKGALEDASVDVVIVCTLPTSHFEIAKAALEAGKHVVVEKPFTTSEVEGLELESISKTKGRLLVPYHNRRWDTDFLTLQHLLSTSLLGRPLDLDTRFDRYSPRVRAPWKVADMPGNGAVYDLGPHLFDQAVLLFGKPSTITAFLYNQRSGAASGHQAAGDSFTAYLIFPSGVRVTASASVLSAELDQPRYFMRGDRGSYRKLHVDPQEPQLVAGVKITDPGFGVEPDTCHGVLTTSGEGGLVREVFPNVAPKLHTEFYRILEQALKGHGVPPVTAEEASFVVRIIEMAIQSSAEGRTWEVIDHASDSLPEPPTLNTKPRLAPGCLVKLMPQFHGLKHCQDDDGSKPPLYGSQRQLSPAGTCAESVGHLRNLPSVGNVPSQQFGAEGVEGGFPFEFDLKFDPGGSGNAKPSKLGTQGESLHINETCAEEHSFASLRSTRGNEDNTSKTQSSASINGLGKPLDDLGLAAFAVDVADDFLPPSRNVNGSDDHSVIPRIVTVKPGPMPLSFEISTADSSVVMFGNRYQSWRPALVPNPVVDETPPGNTPSTKLANSTVSSNFAQEIAIGRGSVETTVAEEMPTEKRVARRPEHLLSSPPDQPTQPIAKHVPVKILSSASTEPKITNEDRINQRNAKTQVTASQLTTKVAPNRSTEKLPLLLVKETNSSSQHITQQQTRIGTLWGSNQELQMSHSHLRTVSCVPRRCLNFVSHVVAFFSQLASEPIAENGAQCNNCLTAERNAFQELAMTFNEAIFVLARFVDDAKNYGKHSVEDSEASPDVVDKGMENNISVDEFSAEKNCRMLESLQDEYDHRGDDKFPAKTINPEYLPSMTPAAKRRMKSRR